MLPNTLQQDVLKSTFRTTLITAQAGSGTTTALLMKLYADAKKSTEKLGIYYRLGTRSSLHTLSTQGPNVFPGSRFSSKSGTLTTKDGVKIKAVDNFSSFSTGSFLPAIAVDHYGSSRDMQLIFKVAGKVSMAMFAEDLNELLRDKESWPYKVGMIDGKQLSIDTKVITGYMFENVPNLPQTYMQSIFGSGKDVISRLTSVKIVFPVDNEKVNL